MEPTLRLGVLLRFSVYMYVIPSTAKEDAARSSETSLSTAHGVKTQKPITCTITTLEAIKLAHEDCFVNDTIRTLVTQWIELQATTLNRRNAGTISRTRKWDATTLRAVTCQCTRLPLPTSFTPLDTARSHIALLATGHAVSLSKSKGSEPELQADMNMHSTKNCKRAKQWKSSGSQRKLQVSRLRESIMHCLETSGISHPVRRFHTQKNKILNYKLANAGN